MRLCSSKLIRKLCRRWWKWTWWIAQIGKRRNSPLKRPSPRRNWRWKQAIRLLRTSELSSWTRVTSKICSIRSLKLSAKPILITKGQFQHKYGMTSSEARMMEGFHRRRNSKNTTTISSKTKQTRKISSWKTEFWKVPGNIQIQFCQLDRPEKIRWARLATKLKIQGPSIPHRDIISICWKIIRRVGCILRLKSSTRRILWAVCPDNSSISYRLIQIEIWCWNQPMISWNLSGEEITQPKIKISRKYS